MRIAAERVLGRSGPGVVTFDDRVTAVEGTGRADESFAILAPGLIDLQVNGFEDVDLWEVARRGDPHGVAALESRLLDHGVTAWQPTLVSAPLDRYAKAFEHFELHRTDSTIGLHLEGPFLGRAPGAHRVEAIVPVDDGFVSNLPPWVSMVTLAPECPGALEAIRRLDARGVRVSLGHSRPSRDEFVAAVEAGAQGVTHLFNGMSGLDHRQPGLAAFALAEPLMFCGLIGDGVHVDPLLMALAFRVAPDRMVLVSDTVAVGDGAVVRDGAPRLADGTLAGSSTPLDEAVRVCVRAGVDLETVLFAATRNPAALAGLPDRGVIEPGRRADLVAFDVDLRVVAVWLGGRRVR